MQIERSAYLDRLIERKDNGSVKVITGIRRCGKSYLLTKLFKQHLLDSGVPESQIVIVALDDIRDKKYLDPDRLYARISEVATQGHTYAVIDEIQILGEFSSLVNGLMHLDDLDLYITGSNSRFLSTDIMTELRGRGDEVRVHSLSFSEFRPIFEGSTSEALREYLLYGGMPALCSRKTHEAKSTYLENLVRQVYLDDIVERNGIRLRNELDDIFDYLCSSTGSFTNPTKLANTLHSVNRSTITDDTVRNYLTLFEEAFLFEGAKRYDIKGKRYFEKLVKYYIADVGLRNARLNFRQLDEGHLMENIVYEELRSRGMNVDVGMVEIRESIEGKSRRKQLEVDFVATEGNRKYYIQVARDINTPERADREKRSLLRIKEAFKKMVIVEDALMPHYDDDGIAIIGLADFLLNKDSLNF
jgi:predicted AAA+ superfamily ATPase